MKQKSEPHGSVPELRQQVFEQWYEEWETPETATSQPAFKTLAHLRGIISRMTRPTSNPEPTAAPRSTSAPVRS